MLSIIVAVANNNVIGKNNKLLWHIPEDLKRFKEITSGHTIIMGRKTFESLPGVLPNRHHIVVTRDESYASPNSNVEVIHNLWEVINRFNHNSEIAFIIGGGDIYSQLINNVDKIFLTKILSDFEGDTTFPQINFDEFKIDYESEVLICKKNRLKYQFVDLSNK